MGRWTQYEEDSYRLPTGMSRIGYDTDTGRYTFRDEQGVIYESEPGNAYGLLRPVVRDGSDMYRMRPNAFESSNSPRSRISWAADSKLSSFDEFLPPAAITRASSSSSTPKQGGLSPPNSGLTGVVLKAKSMKSVASQLQTSKSEGKPHRHSKSLSLIPGFLKLQLTPPLLPRSSRSRAYSEVRDKARADDEDEMRERLLRSSSSSIRGFEPSLLSSRQSSVRSTYRNDYTPNSGRTVAEALRVSSISRDQHIEFDCDP